MTDQTRSHRSVLLWGNRGLINLREPAVNAACKHPLLNGRKLIARGVYSLVFEGDGSAFKLTLDRVAYELAEQQSKWRCRGLPAIKGLYGEVGSTAGAVPMRLIELERLEPLDRESSMRKACLSISRLARKNHDSCETPADQLRDIQPQVTESCLREAVELLSEFAAPRSPYAILDLHAGNFMQRPSSSDPVITDPFLDAEVRWLVQRHYLQTKGLLENTVCL